MVSGETIDCGIKSVIFVRVCDVDALPRGGNIAGDALVHGESNLLFGRTLHVG